MSRKKAVVVASKRGGLESWDCSECGWFTHADAEMAAAHVDAHNRAPKADEAEGGPGGGSRDMRTSQKSFAPLANGGH